MNHLASVTGRVMALALALLLVAGCGGGDLAAGIGDALQPAGFDRQAMLSNLTDTLIVPNHQALLDRVTELEAAMGALVADPNQAALDAAQEAWLAANLARMRVLTYRMSPVLDTLMHNRLDTRPPRVAFIDDSILAGDQDISVEYLDSIGSNAVGLGAMEYLLFDPVGGDSAVLAALTTGADAERRRAYALALAEAATPKAAALLDVWLPGGGNYARAFVEADLDEGDVQGSINMLVNQMIADIEDVISDRLGKPGGYRSNGAVRPDLVESPYAGASLPRIIATLEAVQAAYTGGPGLGLDDYLDFVGATHDDQPLSAAINDQFDRALAALRAIDGPLETAVATDLADVQAAYDEVLALLALVKGDMTNHLGVTITFNLNDGD